MKSEWLMSDEIIGKLFIPNEMVSVLSSNDESGGINFNTLLIELELQELEASPELCHVWEVGKKLWRKDYQGVYECLSKDWGVHLKPIMESLLDSTRHHCLDLISMAYFCISLQDVVNKVGVTGDRLLEKTKVKMEDDDDRYLEELTHYVSFLEN
ncbi:hypothetical protein HELRODRAFT_167566 [Helobdella robusta]|uniref:CSN8/PSMD8/EIF3K domain-containing protein n=1 Tax=Helobdella robusta TaxID=6412 RepID=T1EZH9_HELRO|nr:hypothetical protein HELRODRAFT_167566 [Helobdella robusta]ESO11046.1 hypothetical protein HELRODRAFT_167566 [Helobdella robusta]